MNTPSLTAALHYLRTVISERLKVYYQKENEAAVNGIVYYKAGSPFVAFIEKHQHSFEEYILFLLALTSHIEPDFFNKIIVEHLPEGSDFPEFGGVRATNHRDILPTSKTVQVIFTGDDLEKRLQVQRLLSSEH